MEIIYVLIPIAIVFVIIAIALFFWAVKSNQYDDLDREGINILFDDDTPPSTTSTHSTTIKNNESKND